MNSTNIRTFRNQSGKTQLELSHELEISLRHYQKLESDQSDIKLSNLEKIAKALNVPTCFLLNTQVTKHQRKLTLNCKAEILDMLPIGIQINDTSGLIVFSNRYHQKLCNISDEDLHAGYYIWDPIADSDERLQLKSYLKLLVSEKPTTTPYFTRNKLSNGETVPIRVDWSYIFDDQKCVIAFLSVITPHPSW